MRADRARLLASALVMVATAVCCGVGDKEQPGMATHAISGVVTGDLMDGVLVNLSGAASASTTTDASGRYAFASLADGDYVVTPSSEGYAFSPASADVTLASDDLTADFVSTVEESGSFTIEGVITGDVQAGITVALSGTRSRQVVTGADGRFRFERLIAGQYTVTAALGHWWLQGSGRVLDIAYVDPDPVEIRSRIEFVQYLVAGGGGNPTHLVAGPDGAIWFTDLLTHSIGRIAMDGTVIEYPLPPGSAGPVSIVSGPDGALWYIDRAFYVGRITTAGVPTQYPVFPDPDAGGLRARPTFIVSANDLLYFSARRDEFSDGEHTFPAKGYIGLSSTAGSCQDSGLSITGFPERMAPGPNGTIWFTSTNGMIGKVTDGVGVAEYPIWNQTNPPVHIAAGPDGNMWVTHQGNGLLSKVSVQGVLLAEYDVGGGRPLGNILVRRDGTMWVCEPTRGIVQVNTSGVVTARYTLIVNSLSEDWRPFEFVEGPDGALWCTASGSRILRLTPP